MSTYVTYCYFNAIHIFSLFDFLPEDDSSRTESCYSFKLLVIELHFAVLRISLVIVSQNTGCVKSLHVLK